MSKANKPTLKVPTVNCSDEEMERAQAAVADIFMAVEADRSSYAFWYYIIGVGDGSLASLMGIDALTYCALMLVAGLVHFRKVRGEDR